MDTESYEFTRNIMRYMSRLERRRRRYLDEHLQDNKLCGSMYMAVLFLEKSRGQSQDDLRAFLGIDKSGVARICRRMEDLGYIRREQSQEDRRQNKLYLTESGKKLLPPIRSLLQSWRETVTAGMDENDQKAFLRMLERMLDNALQADE